MEFVLVATMSMISSTKRSPITTGPTIPIVLKRIMVTIRTGTMVSIAYFPRNVLMKRLILFILTPFVLMTAIPKIFFPRVRPSLRTMGTMKSRIRYERKMDMDVMSIIRLTIILYAYMALSSDTRALYASMYAF